MTGGCNLGACDFKMNNVLIVHGLGGNSRCNWFPWLKEELEKLGSNVVVPDFPNSNTPKLDEWLSELKKDSLDDTWILIGHSLGCLFILDVLELLNKSVKAAFLVAGFTGLLPDKGINSLIKTFADKEFDWEKIRANCSSFYVINSDNDPYIPLEAAYQLSLNLAVEVTLIKGAGHFNEAAGYVKFQKLLAMVKKEL